MKMQLTSFSLLILLSTGSAVVAQTQTTTTKPSPSTPATVGTSGRTASAPVATPPAATSTDYRLVNGDKLRIEVYKDPQLSQSLQIRPDGKITLPLLGDMVASGKTSAELRDSITTALKTYISNPTVTVIVTETVPPVFYVQGEVKSPGAFPLNGQMDVIQALALAGGFLDFANTKNIVVRRGTENIRFNYKEAIKSDHKPMYLKPGDVIIVP
jgi:polysaccharide export outer membrane protein